MDPKPVILDIAMNLNRVGNWAADDYIGKRKRIAFFLEQTDGYMDMVQKVPISPRFRKTWERFISQYTPLRAALHEDATEPLVWAEAMMTWGNILTHRAKLA